MRIKLDVVVMQHINHIADNDHGFAVARALAYHLQGEVQALFQPGNIDDTQDLADIGIIQAECKLGNCYLFLTRYGL